MMKPVANSIGGRPADRAAPQGRHPREDLDPGRDRDQHREDHERQLQPRHHARGEHVVGPDREAQQRDRDRAEGDHLVAEDRLAREGRQHFGDDPERRQDHDVDRRVRVEPEHVLPQDRRAAVARDRRTARRRCARGRAPAARRPSAVVAINSISAGGRDLGPDEERHAGEGHPRRAHLQDRDQEVDPGQRRADPDQEDRDAPHRRAGRALERDRRVLGPARVRRADQERARTG